MAPALSDNVLLNLKILVNEISTIVKIRHDTPDMSSSKNHGIWLFLIKEATNSHRV
jgi:hypothetical protein